MVCTVAVHGLGHVCREDALVRRVTALGRAPLPSFDCPRHKGVGRTIDVKSFDVRRRTASCENNFKA